MCLLLGFMISLAWVGKETRNSRSAFLRADQRVRVSEALVDPEAYEQSVNEVKKLQEEKTKLENALSRNGTDSKVLNDSLQEMKSFAGLTEVEGPGVAVTLRDSGKTDTGFGGQVATNPDSVIHDQDVVHVVNELFASGAEAIAVNGHRVAGTTSFRCVGTTILVNDVKIASPIVVRALGDSDTLFGAMNMPGGALSQIRIFDPAMVQVEKVQMMRLPAYTGTTAKKWAKVVAPPQESKAAK
ncbi:hypothetical protein OP10G_4782 [Fimbriimonas ginsengisoli Gsoil 348]|uniref:Division initiation protein n=2 Tax=Fimbriimonas ginsengisoli TaxID=1005039 RepID=A0A068NYH8_FIMGI|nr:hypothetical protein OP10G_4782 [Fimbriimonas ginsengisoli Gsoil 348]